KEFQEADDRLSDDERRIAEELRWLQEHEQDVALQPVDPITERIDQIARRQKLRATLEAEDARDLAELTRLVMAEAGPGSDRGTAREMLYRSLAAELALATHLSARTFQAAAAIIRRPSPVPR
ncbi:MAG: hypothetical protein ABWX59_01705, partial [Microbacteriaceae bacterium]